MTMNERLIRIHEKHPQFIPRARRVLDLSVALLGIAGGCMFLFGIIKNSDVMAAIGSALVFFSGFYFINWRFQILDIQDTLNNHRKKQEEGRSFELIKCNRTPEHGEEINNPSRPLLKNCKQR